LYKQQPQNPSSWTQDGKQRQHRFQPADSIVAFLNSRSLALIAASFVDSRSFSATKSLYSSGK